MRTWLINRWTEFRASFWFLPGFMLVMGVALGLLTPLVEGSLPEFLPPSFHASPTTARATLTALCGAMFTIAGIVFSTAMVALSITSSQLGPRLLRNFQQQAYTQIALGFCLATSVYCLVLLRSIDTFQGNVIVPQFSLLLASILGVATLVVIIYYIHGVAHAMQSQNVVADVAKDLDDAMRRLFPETLGRESAESSSATSDGDSDLDWRSAWSRFDDLSCQSVEAEQDGYLQAIEADTVMGIAQKQDCQVRILARPGDYVCEGQRLLEVCPEDSLDEGAEQRLRRAFLLGNMRTSQQDIECAVNDLVEIAVRALSPGINDPFTAIACLDHLSSTLRRLAQRKLPQSLQHDEEGDLRVVAKPREFRSIVDAAFDQIRQHSSRSVAVTIRLLNAIKTIGQEVSRSTDAMALLRQAEMAIAQARDQGFVDQDFEDIQREFQSVIAILNEVTDGSLSGESSTPTALHSRDKSCAGA